MPSPWDPGLRLWLGNLGREACCPEGPGLCGSWWGLMPRLMGFQEQKYWLCMHSAGLSLEDTVTSTSHRFVVSWSCHSPPIQGSELFTEHLMRVLPT